MPFKFPYTNYQELNLDWMLEQVKKVEGFDGRLRSVEDKQILIDEEVESFIDAIAPEFDETTSYAVGRIVWYHDDLYQYKDAHAAGSWNSSEVIQITVAQLLYYIMERIAPVFDAAADYDPGTYVWRGMDLYRLPAGHTAGTAWSNTTSSQINSVMDEFASLVSALSDTFDTIDGRIGDVESDVSDLKSAINLEFVNDTVSIYDASLWESGGISASNGATSSASTRIRTTNYIGKNIIGINPVSGYKFAIYAYDDDNAYVGNYNGTSLRKGTGTSIAWFSERLFFIDLLQYNVKLVFANTENSSINTSSSTNALLLKFADTIKYLGANTTLGFSSFADSPSGYFSFTSSQGSSMTDKPTDLTSGGICITYKTQASGTYQTLRTTRKIFYRYITTGGTSGNWYKISAIASEVSPTYKWYALGDSLTYGTYTEIGDTQGRGHTDENYVALVSQWNNYDVTNMGEGGMGYLRPGNTSGNNAKAVVDDASVTFSGATLITLALGTNDWGNYTFGTSSDSTTANTICGAMKYVIEGIMTKAPQARLVVISPMNNYRHGGTWDTDWAMNYDRGYGTLSQFITQMKSVCDFYGVQFVNLTEIGPVNRQNISTLLGDGLHPTIPGYEQIAKCLYRIL